MLRFWVERNSPVIPHNIITIPFTVTTFILLFLLILCLTTKELKGYASHMSWAHASLLQLRWHSLQSLRLYQVLRSCCVISVHVRKMGMHLWTFVYMCMKNICVWGPCAYANVIYVHVCDMWVCTYVCMFVCFLFLRKRQVWIKALEKVWDMGPGSGKDWVVKSICYSWRGPGLRPIT